MYLSRVSIADVVISLKGKTRYVGLKSPMNFRLKEFESRIPAKRIAEKQFTISRNKGTYWIFTLYEFESDDYGSILHMLSPAVNSTITSRIRTSQKTAMQAPSHRESNCISSLIQSHCSGFDVLVDLTSSIGIQEIAFLSYQLFSSYIFLSNKPVELENNIRAYLPSLTTQPQVHFLHSSDSSLLRERIGDAKRAVISPRCCVYIDLYCDLTPDQLKTLSNPKVLINSLPIEVNIQQCVEQCVLISNNTKVVLRIPRIIEDRVHKALSCFNIFTHHFIQENPASSCCHPHETSIMIIDAKYPTYQNHHQLSTLWTTEPHCVLRRQINSIFTTVLGDRPGVLKALNDAIIQTPSLTDSEIWSLARQAYLGSFHLSPSSPIDRNTAIKVDRSIVRVYANKMKYVDMVVPMGFRPSSILCLGGIDAHLGHDLAKMYGCVEKGRVVVFGEGDRRKEENRSDYQFVAYPAYQGTSWQEYREKVLTTLHEAIEGMESIDMIVTCCPHAIPFFGSILSSIINKLSADAVVVMNDHSIVNTEQQVLMEAIHDFHRQVTSCSVHSLIDREQLTLSTELDVDDKCCYLSKEDWENRLKQYGLVRYISDQNRKLWNADDPTNLLKFVPFLCFICRSFWGCFQYNGLRDSFVC